MTVPTLLAGGLLVAGAGVGLRLAATVADARWLKRDGDAGRPDGLRGSYLAIRAGAAVLGLGLVWLGWALLGKLGPVVALVSTVPVLVLFDLLPRALTRPAARPQAGSWSRALGRRLRSIEEAWTEPNEVAWSHEALTPLVRAASPSEDAAERNMARRVYDFGDHSVADVMVPLVDVIAVRDDSPLDQVVRIATVEGYSRLPVFHERLPNVIGILHVFDLLAPADARTAADRMSPPTFVPEMAPASDVLRRLQAEGVNLAVVVDEYGGAVGIVTIEDILEEVVGEIEDEYDEEEEPVRQTGPGEWIVDGRAEIEWLNERFAWRLPQGEYETLGGLILARLSRIPEAGEIVRLDEVELYVTSAAPRSVDEIRVRRFADSPGEIHP